MYFYDSVLILHAVLAINYHRREYDTDENDENCADPILSFRETQEPFTVEFTPATVDDSIAMYNLSDLLDLSRYQHETQKATAGGIYAWTIKDAHASMNYNGYVL